MKGTIRRLTALISAVILIIISSVPVFALESSGFEYEIISGSTGVRITGYKGTDANVVIPSTLDGRTVEEISNSAFAGKTGITSVEMPSNIKRISQEAFRNCSGLTNVDIPASVSNISEYAFAGCVSLTEITIASASTAIGFCAFEGCTALKEITIPCAKIAFGAFRNCTALQVIDLEPSVQSIGRYAFDGTAWYNSQKAGLLTLGNAVYSYNGDSENVVIPDNMKCIADFAFYGSDITTVVIPDGMYYIGSSVFTSCENLTYISVPSSVISIGTKAFGYDENNILEDFTVYCYEDSVADIWSANNGLDTYYIDSCTHSFGEWDVIQTPDCTTEGSRIRRCTMCNEAQTEILPPDGHKWSGWVELSKLTCTNDGVKRRTCTVCGIPEDDVQIAKGHTWGAWTVITDATCTTEGERTRTCSVCNEESTEKISPLGHLWVIDDTTDEEGWVVLTESTCIEEGVKSRLCAMCGHTDVQPVEPKGHTADEWTVVKDPTAVTTGTKQGVCNVCGEIFTQDIPMIEQEIPDDVNMLTPVNNATVYFDDSKTCIYGVTPGTTVTDVLTQFEYPGHILVTDITLEEISGDSYIGSGCFLFLIKYSEETQQNEPVDTACIIIKGDVNGDGLVTAADARLALQASAKTTELQSPYLLAADIDANGTVTALEARKILRVSSKIDTFDE